MSTLADISLVNRDGVDFSDLNADLDAERTAEAVAGGESPGAFHAFYGDHKAPSGVICPKCKGCGRFRVQGRFQSFDKGPCFTCDGTGSISAEKAKSLATRERNRIAREREQAAARAEWVTRHEDVLAWIRKKDGFNTFATKMSNILGEGKSLTVGQVEAIRKIIADDAARQQKHATNVAASSPAGSGVDLTNVPAGRYAVPNGDTRLKVLIRKPEAPGKWAGWVFVSDAAEYGQRQKYGSQAPGKSYSGKIVAEMRTIAADPKAAAIAYGKLTGTCSICGRALENEESVARGIGPICADKAGW